MSLAGASTAAASLVTANNYYFYNKNGSASAILATLGSAVNFSGSVAAVTGTNGVSIFGLSTVSALDFVKDTSGKATITSVGEEFKNAALNNIGAMKTFKIGDITYQFTGKAANASASLGAITAFGSASLASVSLQSGGVFSMDDTSAKSLATLYSSAGLSVNKEAFLVNKGFTYTAGSNGDSLTLASKDADVSKATGLAAITPYKTGSSFGKISINGAADINFNSKDGKAYFQLTGGSVVGFNFATAKDALDLSTSTGMSKAVSFSLNGSVFGGIGGGGVKSGFSIAEGSASSVGILTLNSTTKDGGGVFDLDSIAGSTKFEIGGVSATFGTEGDNALAFEVSKKGAVTLKAATVAAVDGAGVSFAGFTAATDITIAAGKKSGVVNVNRSEFDYYVAGTDLTKILAAGISTGYLNEGKKAADKAFTVSKATNIDRIAVTGSTTSLTAVNIGSGTYTIKSLTGLDTAHESLDSQNSFIMKNGEATGFMFASAGSGVLVFDSASNAAKLKLYNGGATDADTIAAPTLGGTGVVALGKTANDSYNVIVGTGATAALKTDDKTVTLDLSNWDKSSKNPAFVDIAFGAEGFGSLSVAASPLASTGTTAPETIKAGAAIKVTGDVATESGEGLQFFGSSKHVAFATGNYSVGFKTTLMSDGTVVTMDSASDTLYSAGGASRIYFGSGEGSLSEDTTGAEYVYANTSGKAYFNVSTDDTINSFIFGSKGDAITVGEEADLPSLGYLAGGTEETLISASPSVESGSKTITMVSVPDAKGDDTLKATFELSGLGAGVAATVGTDNVFTFSDEGGTVLFNQEGAAQGFGASAGTVTLSATAATLLGALDDDDNPYFTINGTVVNIAASNADTNGVVYNMDDNGKESLLGLGAGTRVTNAGTITKIYVAPTDNTTADYYFGTDGGDDDVTFTISANGSADDNNLSYFTLADGKVTGFTFMSVDDSIHIPEEGVPEGFLLYDGVTGSGSGFTAPQAYDSDDALRDYTVVRMDNDFAVSELNEGDYVKFDKTKVQLVQASGDTIGIGFNVNGELTSVLGVEESGDAVRVTGATEAVKFGLGEDAKSVEITGDTARFLYTIGEDSLPAISEVAADATIKAVADATKLTTAEGQSGLGKFTFVDGSDSATFEVAGDENSDTIEFALDGLKVTGISGVDNESVKGAFFDEGAFNLNGESVEVQSASAATQYTFSDGTSIAGLLDDDTVAAAGETITDFITAGASGTYTIIDKTYAVEGENDGVTFKVTNGALSEIAGLDEGATVKGNFTGVTVNGDTINIEGDEDVYLVAGAEGEGIAKVGGLSGEVTLNDIGEATQLGADGDGTFTFGLGEEGTDDDATLILEGNKEIETTFTLGESGVDVAGMDEGEKLTGWFQEEITVEGNKIQVLSDEEITVVNGASGISIEGLTGGASVVTADGILSAKTDAISGESAAFTFANGTFNISGQDDDGVEFVLDGQANVVGISGLAETATVTGDLNGVIINGQEPDIQVVGISGPNTNLTYENGILTGLVDGDTVISADNVSIIRNVEDGTFTFGEGGQVFTVEGDSSVDFVVQAGTVSVAEIANLAPSATVRGNFENITVNGDLIDIVGDNEVYLVGGEIGITKVGGLSGDVTLNNIGEAEQLGADGDGTFTFALGEEGADDDATLTLEGNKEIETTFTLDEAGEGTVIVEGMDEGEKLTGWFWEEISVEGHAIQVLTDEQITAVYGASSVAIEGLGDGAIVVKADGVSVATTEAISGSAAFHFATNGSFSVAGEDANGVVFALDGKANVTGINDLDEDVSVTGALNDLTAVNGASFSVTDADGILTIVGNAGASGIKAIAGVNGDATISNAGGATYIQTASEGAFTFGEGGQVFEVAGDSSVDFMLQAGTVSVAAIENLATNATVKGQFENITVNGDLIDIVGDNDVYLVAGPSGEGIAKVGGLSGDVTLNAIGWAYELGADGDGTFNLALGAEGTDDDATLTLEGNKEIETTFTLGESGVDVAGMDEGERLTAWFQEEVSVEGKKIHVLNDEQITAVYSADGISLEGLTGGAQIVNAESVTVATTDGEGTFTFKDGREIAIAGDSQVTFTLDGNGNLVNIGDLEETATVTGNLNGLTFVEGGTSIDVRNASGQNVNLWYSNGTLSNIVPADTIISADGATMVAAAGNGLYVFGEGENAQTFNVQGDSGIIGFRVIDDNRVTTITELDAGATVFGALNNLRVNNGAPLRVVGDTEFGAVAGAEGLAALTGLGGESNAVTVNEADGAKRFETVTDGIYTLLQNDPYSVGGDSNGVVFGLNSDNKVSSIEDVNGYVLGSFTDTVTVNNEDIQVTSDTDGVFVYGDGAKVTALADVNAGSNVAAWGSASKVSTKGAGEFAFSTVQNFIIGTDSSVTFVTGASGVTGIDDITSSTITFDANQTNALEVNAGINNPLTNIASETLVTLTTDENGVLTTIDGVTGSISGVQNATVAATGPITVNGKEFDITDADSKFNVVAQNGVTKATAVTGDATVNVASAAVETDELGNFVIGGDSFKFSDDDGNVNFTTDADKKLTAVDLLNGTMEINGVSSAGVYVGSNLVAYYGDDPTTPVTITAANDSLVAIDGLDDGSTIGGDLGGAIIAMAGTSSSVTPAELNVNGNAYQLYNDADGVNIIPATTGYTSVEGLANDASLNVVPGTYVVNGQVLEVEEGDVIVGASDGQDAYIYDGSNPYLSTNVDTDVVKAAFGLPEYDTNLTPPPEGPLTSEELADIMADVDPDQPLAIWTTNKNEKITQELDFSGDDFTKEVHLYEGPQDVKFNNDFGNLAEVDKSATGEKNITFGNGGNAAIVRSQAALGNQVNIVGGTGDDTYVVLGSVETNINMGGANGGADMLLIPPGANARVNLSNYDASSGAGIQLEDRKTRDRAHLLDAINKNTVSFGEGTVELSTSQGKSVVNVGQVNGGTLVNLYAHDGSKQMVGFTGAAGGAVGDAATTEDQLLIGNKNGTKTGGSSLTGGAGNDTAMAGAGDVVDLGAGNNLAQLQDDSTRGGADINLSQGRTTITGMNNTLDEAHGDVLGIDLTKAVVSFDGTNLIVEGTDFYAIATDADKAGTLLYDSADLATSADEATANISATYDKYTTQIIQSGDATWRSAIGAEGSVMQVESDEDLRANYYKGVNSGVTFEGYMGDVVVDLSQDWTSTIDGREAIFDGINSLKAGGSRSKDMFKGSADNETLLAAQGYASMYGAGGNNVLYGYNSDTHADKEGYATFFVLGQSDGAANVIKDFEFINDNNYKDTQKVTADMVEILVQDSRVLDAYLSGNDVVIDVINNTNGVTESAVIEGAKGKDFRITNGVIAQVNEDTLKFDKYANYYYATGKNATVTVDTTLDEANVWLGTDSQLKKDFFGDIAVLDATGFTGKANLVGTDWRDNTIIAGSGETSLWGGSKNFNDVMQGGAGKDTFFYAYGNGNDTVNGAGNGDVINLAVSLDQLYTEIGSDSVVLNFTDGGKLTVNDGGADVSYIVQGDNNATYKVDRSTNTWVRNG